MHTRVVKVLSLLVWCSLIFFLSSQPRLPGPEDGLFRTLFMKSAHVVVYAVMYVLALRAFSTNKKAAVHQAILFCFLYAVSDEFHQTFVPGRGGRVSDVLIDMGGVVLSWASVRYIQRAK